MVIYMWMNFHFNGILYNLAFRFLEINTKLMVNGRKAISKKILYVAKNIVPMLIHWNLQNSHKRDKSCEFRNQHSTQIYISPITNTISCHFPRLNKKKIQNCRRTSTEPISLTSHRSNSSSANSSGNWSVVLVIIHPFFLSIISISTQIYQATTRVPLRSLVSDSFEESAICLAEFNLFVDDEEEEDRLHLFSRASSISICSSLHSWLQKGVSPLQIVHLQQTININISN